MKLRRIAFVKRAGAWGSQPYANDTAADWFFTALKGYVPDNIYAGLNSEYPEEVRAAAFLLQQLGFNYVYDVYVREAHLDLAIAKLRQLLAGDWTLHWKNPDEVRSEIQKQIDKLQAHRNGLTTFTLMDKMRQVESPLASA